MLTTPPVPAQLAHDGTPLLPHDTLTAWHLEPPVVLALLTVAVLYARGHRARRDTRRRTSAFVGGMVAISLALTSPVDALSSVLLSAHMVQHVLLVTIGAPLLAFATPGAAIMRGLPDTIRRAVVPARRALGLDAAALRRLRHPIVWWLLFVATFWTWHASRLYGAAVEHDLVHAAEHVTFLATALLLWSAIVGPERLRAPEGAGVLVVFLLALQSVLLAALLTFARTPWYEPYTTPAPGWGLDPLADQHLAGVIMWVPAGLVHTGIGIALLVGWLRDLDRGDGADADRAPDRPARPVLPT